MLHPMIMRWKQMTLLSTTKSHNNNSASFISLLRVVAFIEALADKSLIVVIINKALAIVVVGGVIS